MAIARSGGRFILALALCLLSVSARSEDNGTNNTGTVNCGDAATKNACIECCTTPASCVLTIHCCPLSGPCNVTNKPTGDVQLKLNETSGGLKLQFQRVVKSDAVDIKLKLQFLKKTFPKPLVLKARLTGSDAKLGALLFPVLFLGQGSAAAANLQLAGYDVQVAGILPTCQSLFPTEACAEFGTRLSRGIHGALSASLPEELTPFVDGTTALGWPACGGIF